MIKKTAVLLVLGLLISVNPGAVFAVDTASPTEIVSPSLTPASDLLDDANPSVSIDPPVLEEGSTVPRFVGLQLAWLNISETISKLLARTEEKKADVQLRYAEKTEKLKERIEMSENPERFKVLLERMEIKQQERVQQINSRMEKLGEKKEEFQQRMNQWEIRKEERRQIIDKAKEAVQNRPGAIERPVVTGVNPKITVTVSPTAEPEMRGRSVRIDKPSASRVEMR